MRTPWETGPDAWRTMMIDASVLSTIEETLRKGDRVEIIPVKDGVKIIEVKRRELKQNHGSRR